MFKDKNWFEVIGSEVAAIVATLAVFFLCRYIFDMGNKELVAVTIAFIGVVSIITIIVFTTTVAIAAITAIITVMAAASTSAATLFVGITVATAIVVTYVSKELNLPGVWVYISYMAEAIIIFLPIFFAFN